jgi:hypothetical protein
MAANVSRIARIVRIEPIVQIVRITGSSLSVVAREHEAYATTRERWKL